jgi:glycosyltransferase involved in cell wall biosynthesis
VLRSFMNVTLAGATCVIAISNATRDAILNNFEVDERKVVAIPGPIDFGATPFPPVGTKAISEKPFILMITNALPHKNTARALSAISASLASREGVALKIVGSADPLAIEQCQRQGVEVQVHRGVSDEVLNGWLAHALFLFSPSLQEGLNLPVAEALSAGTRVVCSDIPVHREFYRGRASMCDPLRVEAMVDAINTAIRGAWPEQDASLSPRPSFADVAAGYRKIFTRISTARADDRTQITF